jgi:hypothetical protein
MLAATWHVSVATVTAALRLLAATGLVSKEGKSWVVGAGRRDVRTSVAPKDQEFLRFSGPGRGGSTVVCLGWRESTVERLSRSDYWGPFLDSFVLEVTRGGSYMEGLSVTEEPCPTMPGGMRAVGRRLRTLGERCRGILVVPEAKTTAPELERWLRYLHELGRRVIYLSTAAGYGDVRKKLRDLPNLILCRQSDVGTANRPGAAMAALRMLGSLRHGCIAFPCSDSPWPEWVRTRFDLLSNLVQYVPGVESLRPGTPEAIAGDIGALRATVDRLARTYGWRVPGRAGRYMDTMMQGDGGGGPGGTQRRFRELLVDSLVLIPLLADGTVTALLTPNDSYAIRYHRWLSMMEVRVPDRLSLLSFDNSPKVAGLPISSIDLGMHNLGFRAAQVFLGDVAVRPTRDGRLLAQPTLNHYGSIAKRG